MIHFDNDRNWKKTQDNILEMSHINPTLWTVLYALWRELSSRTVPFRVTSVYYPPGAFGSVSLTHAEHRAVDIGGKTAAGEALSEDTGERIANRINNKFVYFGMKACVYHKANGGEYHFHCQVPRDETIGYSVVAEGDHEEVRSS